MGKACCGGEHPPSAFRCHGCGHCCTELRGRWQRDPGRFAPVPGTPLTRLATPGGLRLFAWEAARFPEERLLPLLVVPDSRSERLVVLAYELDADRCPHWDDGCSIYKDRPLVCRSFPLLVLEGDDGLEVGVSSLCPARVPVVGAVEASTRPKRVLAGTYPHEAAAALAIPALVQYLARLVDHLVAADLMEPARGLDEQALGQWAERGVVSIVDACERAGTHDAGGLAAHAREVRDDLHARLAGPG